MADSSLYASCAEALTLAQSSKDDLADLLDPDTGFAPKMRQICQTHLAEAQENTEKYSIEELEALRMESDTWGLLQAVMPMRKTAYPSYPRAAELLAENPYTPPSTLAQAIMHASRLLEELVVVREWLHDTAPTPASVDATTGYWKFTKHQVMQALRMNKAAGLSGMDPDAVNREEDENLAPDDATYEKALTHALYAHVRAGKLDDAVELCRKAHQPWRAASIRGSTLFQWRAVANEPRDEDAMDESEDFDVWRGNRRRKLWKSACISAALNPNLPTTERALYAALAPSPQTASNLKAACRTWSDHLWAQISVVCEEKESQEMSRLRSSFWENPAETDVNVSMDGDEEAEEEEWEQEVVGSLESLAHISVEEGAPSDNPYHISQLNIILDRTDALLEAFAVGLKEGRYDPESSDYPTMTRFFAHLCLFLQLIDMSPPPLATQVILEAYLQVLEAAGQRELIAMYAGALGDNAVERYAMFLTSLELSADISERRLALTRARDHGLDMERVAVVTAERTIEKAFSVLPPAKGALPSVIGLQAPPSDAELLLVRSIEWTTYLESTYDTALEQANVIVRYLLGCGRVQVAKSAMEQLPTELNTIRDPEERSIEFLHYRQFFMVWDALERVVETQALEVPQMTRESRAEWLADYRSTLDAARERVVRLLTTEWLVPDSARGSSDRRTKELLRIRQIYVPELVIRLHAMLYSSRARIPGNLKHALELANIVADSRYRLYDDFADQPGRRLGDYLGAVRQAVLGGLEGGGSDPFRVLTM
ncbi:nuclear pore complex protein [Phanerochaete sordida]|uniref:Nuclear pore complex protein n=1 Tax=Phanerochaete sordida TaxID=48140 RepID=A0A9P3GB28_9APHY|nr:nuclear pore complex protein [Phanerochaete sordida]